MRLRDQDGVCPRWGRIEAANYNIQSVQDFIRVVDDVAKKYTVALPREDVPRAGKELENVQITAYVQGARCEEDGDYHLVLSDSTIATAPRANVCMVTEFPVPTEGTDEDRKPLMHAT
jgi:hypothetical protein